MDGLYVAGMEFDFEKNKIFRRGTVYSFLRW